MISDQCGNMIELLNLRVQLSERSPRPVMKGAKSHVWDDIFVEMSAKDCSWDVKIASNFFLCRQISNLRNNINQEFILFMAHESTNRWNYADNDTSAAAQASLWIFMRVSHEFRVILLAWCFRDETFVKNESDLEMTWVL